MIIELTKFKVKKNQTQLVNQWLAFLNEHMQDVLLTLEDEKMYVETIFRERSDGEEYLYWYSIQGEGGKNVEESEHWVDQIHLDYWRKCIDADFRPVDLNPEVIMIPERIKNHMLNM